MPNLFTTFKSWAQHLGLTIVFLRHVAYAAPADIGSIITQARVQQMKQSINNNLGDSCCTLLKLGLGSLVSTPGSTTYQSSTSSYFSSQAQSVDPWCVVSPSTTLEVSHTVGTLNLLRVLGLQCQFAARSGGHTPWAGAATIQNGVQIDLSAINQVTIAVNQKTTFIGPGARWLDVYMKLDAMSLTVPGGRAATVGVGGLVTGGGISFFSGRYGFTADNVVKFEVVLYDGSVVTASASSRPDLFYALKGGSNNFGIVTRFDLVTFSCGNFWGGAVVWPISAKTESLAAFVKFTGQANYDVYGALIHTYSWSAANGGWIIANNMEYTKPVVNPPVFQEFMTIQPQYVSTMRISNLSDFTLEIAASNAGSRKQLFYTSTWSNDLQTLVDIVELSEQYLQTVASVAGLEWSLSLQPLVAAITTKSAATGGNPLGLDGSDGNLILSLITASWTNTADDAAVLAAVSEFYAAADALAASRGKLDSYKYLNYAYETQDPIKGYGTANVAKLRAISNKYDPAGVFQTLVPGGWKLW
ncbi:FAD-binding domain-containing protein [Cadophora sp. DSE1049]|nr:FAD-binding domain-containing protein [Cadophora sp. DSE1049]